MRKLLYLLAGMLLLLCNTVFAQQREVTGKVTDANGVPVNGASIRIKNARTGTSTAADGYAAGLTRLRPAGAFSRKRPSPLGVAEIIV